MGPPQKSVESAIYKKQQIVAFRAFDEERGGHLNNYIILYYYIRGAGKETR